jgi:uracil phosphoribosyltransferase
MAVIELNHPLAAHLVTMLRNRVTEPEAFRQHARHLTTLLALKATESIGMEDVIVETPLMSTKGRLIRQTIAAVPILRAGLGMLEPVVDLFPSVQVGYIGLERDEGTALAHSYYSKMPNLAGSYVLCLDPMLATGGSASQAMALMRPYSPAKLTMVCVVAAPEGIAKLSSDHPDVDIVTAAIDEGLNEKKYILPGLGDFGDRLYGTQ